LCPSARHTPRVEEMLNGVPRDRLVSRRDEKWTIQEQVGHLLDLESLWRTRVDDFIEAKPQLTAADLQNRKTHEANHNARDIAELLREFRTARTALVTKLDSLDHAVFSQTLLHPRRGTRRPPSRQDMGRAPFLIFLSRHNPSPSSPNPNRGVAHTPVVTIFLFGFN